MFIVEGNIGAGKSTFLKLIKQQVPSLDVIFEPVLNWQHEIAGQSILTNFIQDPKRWAYTMETIAMSNRVQEHIKEQNNPNPLRLMERSIYSGHYCFAVNGHASGYFTPLEWLMYVRLFEFLVPTKCRVPQGFIYLKVDPEIAYERISKRNRTGENKISLDYLRLLDERHHAFLIEKRDILPELKSIPVLVLNCNAEFESDGIQFQLFSEQVRDFMHKQSVSQSAI